jgi:hypothetical protein
MKDKSKDTLSLVQLYVYDLSQVNDKFPLNSCRAWLDYYLHNLRGFKLTEYGIFGYFIAKAYFCCCLWIRILFWSWYSNCASSNMRYLIFQGQSYHGTPLQIIDMGSTKLEKSTFEDYISNLRQIWT